MGDAWSVRRAETQQIEGLANNISKDSTQVKFQNTYIMLRTNAVVNKFRPCLLMYFG